jgi:peptide/nickel transport system permease protein
MAQRVTLALALAGEPSLLIADEPTTSLDVTVQAEILDLMRTIQREVGLAIIYITHDFDIVSQLCDRVVVLYAGDMVEQGPVRSAIAQPLHPYTAGLLGCGLGHLPVGEPFPTIPGTVPRPGEWGPGCRFATRCAWKTDDCTLAEGRQLRLRDDRQVRCLLPGVAAARPPAIRERAEIGGEQ